MHGGEQAQGRPWARCGRAAPVGRAAAGAAVLSLWGAAAGPAAAAPAHGGAGLEPAIGLEWSHRHVFPALRADRDTRAATWAAEEGGLRSPAEAPVGGGSRAAAFVELPAAVALQLEVRWVGADGRARRTPMERTFTQADASVFVADLGESAPEASLWIGVIDDIFVESIRWELLRPRFPEAGPRSRALALGPRPPPPPSLDSALTDIGVVSRSSWGARSTTCTSAEDDWYRMAVHHTAGTQTSGGTVAGAVAAVQAYAMDSGSYCDIPYQFMVGHDGSLYEGRALSLTSGATGGGQNDGNAALCFLGCYHPSDCPAGSHAATDAMIDAGRLLIQTMSALHDIPIDTDHIKGHRDWPGNSTACPGEHVVDRFSELLIAPERYAGRVLSAGFATDGSAPLVLELGQQVELSVEVENTGNTTWRPGETFLATLPRDVEGPLSHPSWPSPTRLAGPSAEVPPGGVGRFSFVVEGARLGRAEQQLALVQEWVTWFADAPLGGGPAEGTLGLLVEVVEPAAPGADTALVEDSGMHANDGGGGSDASEGGEASAADTALVGRGPPGELVPAAKLGGCAQAAPSGRPGGAPGGGLGCAVLGGIAAALARGRRAPRAGGRRPARRPPLG